MKRMLTAAGLAVVLFLGMTLTHEGMPVNAPGKTANGAVQQRMLPVTYTADVELDPKNHRVRGTVSVRFVPPDREKAYFHLYPNVFQDDARLKGENWVYLLGKDRQPGNIAIRDVKVDGHKVPLMHGGEDGTILEVPLGRPVSRDGASTVEMTFELTVPHNNGRLSYNDHAMWLGNWLPILAVKEANGWRLDPYYPVGDPFYSDVAEYHLKAAVPAGYQLATTGTESRAVVTQTQPQGVKRYEIDASNVRDFALVVMDETYRVQSSRAGNVLVRTWWQQGDPEEQVKRLHETAVQAIRYYSGEFGDYPYAEYDVVKTGGFFGGMEYPSIVFVQENFFEEQVEQASVVVAHETAHQWFYGLVGSDEVREAWVDEGLTDYATMAFLNSYDPELGGSYVRFRKARALGADKYIGKGISAWQPLERFPDWASYGDLVYARPATMLWNLREAWGERRLHQALRQYVLSHMYGQGSGKAVVNALTAAAGADASPYVDFWLKLRSEKEAEANAWLEKGKEHAIFFPY
ncbi:M1 family metallopeptidase [Brevibacillus sp. SYP-B805]|uniref:M1 family metallopeptidase n=1 Tax=Brevibacillus sp. SYP-B805 TaxID=1578199 RepID=UPI0013EB3400|nr:M1 family metallopeptidase [Brevibacillus sp. SYP-B805]NGQ97058.1 M1 family metallopeptidase [Brevibacillus sp. SYP-B805]